MDAKVISTPTLEAANPWHTTPVTEADLEAFTRMQYKAFVGTGNPLHDTLFPPASNPSPTDFAKGAARHRAALVAEPENVIFIKVVDDKTGEMAGGAKWYFYTEDAGRPERAEVDWVEPEEQEFAQRVMDEFHGTFHSHKVCGRVLRVSRMKGPHACKYYRPQGKNSAPQDA
jgi:hypothetical protein